MTDIEWGAEIAVNGVRPEWLRDGEMPMQYQTSASSNWHDMKWGWGFDVVGGNIRLPANHPYYKATSRGFTYWPGGESAPEDWDGSFVLYASGKIGLAGDWELEDCYRWNNSYIIGYRKRTEQPAPAIAPELVERMVRLVRLCSDVICAGPYADEARAILAELEPDPDLTLAKSIMGDAEAIALAIKAARENGRG